MIVRVTTFRKMSRAVRGRLGLWDPQGKIVSCGMVLPGKLGLTLTIRAVIIQ